MRVKCEFVELFDRTFGRGGEWPGQGSAEPLQACPGLPSLDLSYLSVLMKMRGPDEFTCHNSGPQ
eukprot:1136765-Pelagomonas_calceolata.AAC.4